MASVMLRETFSYHCSACSNFDICCNCFGPMASRHPIHIHELTVVDTRLIYARTGGRWECDVCGQSSRPYETFSHHCAGCKFDVCHDCFKPQTTPLHNHPLYRADTNHVYAQFSGGWRCDNCGSVHNNPTDNKPWHCQTCEYDLCHPCMSTAIEVTDRTGPSLLTLAEPRGWNYQASVRRPEENPWVTRDRLTSPSDGDTGRSFVTEKGNIVVFPEDTDDNSKCMEQTKIATVIHGVQCAQERH
ncbi:hypothetical protein OS493_036861 [Desmophyllum pertusum]|uniref:ZZ-type domain-containing protein n=1 Tax=Desmophyllum pertusum TaxID=174260 RepID=A0A9W9Z6D4_9CNID|nr:hypothetical protein OS493_036861 [Desmophyllum pertusum]